MNGRGNTQYRHVLNYLLWEEGLEEVAHRGEHGLLAERGLRALEKLLEADTERLGQSESCTRCEEAFRRLSRSKTCVIGRVGAGVACIMLS
jgi:hypothetical protein